MTISLKKKLTFEELVQQNRKQILEDNVLLDKIEQKLEKKFREAK
ncbi:FbpB family small basic protein [Oceanobacillus salinisoli]|nr:FbpB family small basic protein [Oceanobacillus salinisoli]